MREKKIFVRKPYDKFLYKWSPSTEINKNNRGLQSGLPTGCSATAFSQGEDFVTTYSYNNVVIGNTTHHYAYVECDYVA